MTGSAPRSREGGRGWAIVAATFVVLFLGFGAAYSFGSFFDALERGFGESRASVSAVFSLAVGLYFLVGAGTGALADRWGARWIVAAGIVIAGGGLVLASFAEAFWQLCIAYGLGIGLGVGMAYVPSVGAIQKTVTRRRGLATGIAVAGIGAGTLCLPILASALIDDGGWRHGLRVLGWCAIAIGVPAALLIAAPRTPRRDGAACAAAAGTPLGQAVRARPFVLIFGAYLLISLGNFIPIVHLVPFAMDRGIPRETAVVLLSLIGVGSTVGRFALGGAADRFGARRALAFSFAGLGASCLWWLGSGAFWQMAVFALAMGTFYGGFVALGPTVMAEYFGTGAVSGIIGTLYTGVGVGTLVGPPLAGLAFDLWQSYTLPILACAVASLAAGALVAVAEEPAAWRARRVSTKALEGGVTS